jgi:phage tail-like protein
MNCLIEDSRFLIIGGHVGWPGSASTDLALDSDGTLRLTSASTVARSVPRADVDRLLHPSWLSSDGAGRWLVVGPDGVLRRVDWCGTDNDLRFEEIGHARAVASGPRYVAILDAEGLHVDIMSPGLLRHLSYIRVPATIGTVDLIGWVSSTEIILVCRSTGTAVIAAVFSGVFGRPFHDDRLESLDRIGRAAPVDERPDDSNSQELCARSTLVVGSAVVDGPEWSQLYEFDARECQCRPLDGTKLRACLPVTVETTERAFRVPAGHGGVAWISRDGDGVVEPPEPSRTLATVGQIIIRSIDSYRDDSVWFRVRLDADAPPGTWMSLRVVTHRLADATPDVVRWHHLPQGATDALIEQPPGRYLSCAVELHGDGVSTPVVRHLRFDLNPSSTIDQLPAVYRADPVPANFLRRFLAIMDAELNQIDVDHEEAGDLLVPRATDRAGLRTLCSLVGLELDADWESQRVVDLLGRPELLTALGTPAALAEALQILLGATVHVEEVALSARSWVVLGPRGAPIGGGRLPSRYRSATTLGRSEVGTQLVNAGEIETDAHDSGAFVLTLHIRPESSMDRDVIERTVRQLVPAHLDVHIRVAERRMAVGGWMLVGVDTTVDAAPASIAGGRRAAVLGRTVVAGAHGGVGVTVGRRARVGLSTTVG